MNDNRGVTSEAIGLALSGGGIRAATFHAGVLRYLAEQRLLEKIVHVSSVSGGSLFVGMVLRHADYSWPSSEIYLNEVFPRVRKTLVTQSLQRSALSRLVLNPLNWCFILSRANVLAQAIRGLWDVKASLGAIKNAPAWSINCTTGETGRRYRFKNGTMGDYELGYTDVEDFSLARAMAISAAFPGGIGPLTLKTNRFYWKKRKHWDVGEAEPYQPPFNRLHLYDGGLYDNLGIEPMFDVGRQELKKDDTLRSNITYLLVSDGGAPLARNAIPHPLNPFRFKRIADIALDQSRALRVRAFMNFLQKNPAAGAYVGIGMGAESSIRRLAKGREAIASELLGEDWLSAADSSRAAIYSTNLCCVDEPIFDLLERHGYETAKWNVEMMSQEQDTNCAHQSLHIPTRSDPSTSCDGAHQD
jgi:NTE family protein